MRPELVTDTLEFLLCVAVKESILALIGVVSLILLRVPALQGLQIVLDVILA